MPFFTNLLIWLICIKLVHKFEVFITCLLTYFAFGAIWLGAHILFSCFLFTYLLHMKNIDI